MSPHGAWRQVGFAVTTGMLGVLSDGRALGSLGDLQDCDGMGLAPAIFDNSFHSCFGFGIQSRHPGGRDSAREIDERETR